MSTSAERSRGREWLRPWRIATVTMVGILVAVGVLELLPANDYVLLPGDALPVAPMIAVKGIKPLPGPGNLYMTDVSLYKADHLLEDLWGRLNPDASVEPAENVAGNLSQQKFNQENVALMMDSIHQAEAAALSTVPGYHLRCSPGGPEIAFVLNTAPAAKVLRAGDLLDSIDGHRADCAKDVRPLVQMIPVGDTAHLTVHRGGHTLHLAVRTIGSSIGRPGHKHRVSLIGVELADRFVFPVKIDIRVGDIGGPSAGLMFSLGIIERLEHRDLARGCKVAGTGTISFDGTVGEIGGARQKVIAARNAGARYFLVPDVPDNLVPAEQARGNIQVVPVKTLHEALAFLHHLRPCG